MFPESGSWGTPFYMTLFTFSVLRFIPLWFAIFSVSHVNFPEA
ncbi:hypothetical protein C1A50_1232 [Paenibacillus polymyxa]|nr:hypothetical protein C1A50_1232 [Paenibacillus polymyxa]